MASQKHIALLFTDACYHMVHVGVLPYRGTFQYDPHMHATIRFTRACYNMGLIATKPVFGVSDKARLKPVSSATETD